MSGLDDPRVHAYRQARAAAELGLSAPTGARERYMQSIAPYVECMAEMTPEDNPTVRKAMMRVLFQDAGLPLGVILGVYRATEDEAEYVKANPPLVAPQPVDEQDRLHRMPYGAYLRTPHWQAIRKEALRRSEGRCAICNSPSNLEVHHRDYTRRGAERPADVTVLCDQCHGRHHNEPRRVA